MSAPPSPTHTQASLKKHADKTRWGVVALAIAAGMVASMQIGKVPPALSLIRPELAIGLVTAGWVASIFNATSAGLGSAIGMLADRLGHGRLLLAGVGLLALGSLGGSLATSGGALLTTRLFEGVGFVIVAVSAPSVIGAVTAARDHRLAFSFWGAYMPAGIALMMVLSPLFIETAGWRALWVGNGLMLALFLLLLLGGLRGLLARPRPSRHAAPVGKGELQRALRSPGAWLLAASFGTFTLQWFALMTWLPTFLAEQLGFSARAAALISAGVVFASAPGSLLGGRLMHHGAKRWAMLAFANGAMGLIALLIFAAPAPPQAKIAFAIGFSFIGGFLPVAAFSGVALHSPSPRQIGLINGVVVQGANTGSLLGPPLSAWAIGLAGGWDGSSRLMIAAGFAGVLLALVLRRVERRLVRQAVAALQGAAE